MRFQRRKSVKRFNTKTRIGLRKAVVKLGHEMKKVCKRFAITPSILLLVDGGGLTRRGDG